VAKALDGANYRAVRRLSTKDNETLAHVGESCARVPADSLPALVASGEIVRLRPGEAAAAPAPRRRKEEL